MIFHFKKNKIAKFKKGMTYVELIVVLSIFSIMSAIALLNYKDFQAKVDIKNLANDIALQIVGAQKDAMAGKLSGDPDNPFVYKPAYGIRFDLTDNNHFIYFADIDGTKSLSDGDISHVIEITNGSYIYSIDIYSTETDSCASASDLDIVFTRPNSSAAISYNGLSECNAHKAIITIKSKGDIAEANISIYPSGRVEIK